VTSCNGKCWCTTVGRCIWVFIISRPSEKIIFDSLNRSLDWHSSCRQIVSLDVWRVVLTFRMILQ
jgi:hypothetical protein